MAPSTRVIVCSHTCGPCSYSGHWKREANQHLSVPAKHPHCTQDCPRYWNLSGSGIKVETPESFEAKMVGSKRQASKAQKPIGKSKILCILDPSRRATSSKETSHNVSWMTINSLPSEVVKRVLDCTELKGYAFPVCGKKDALRIYDWVSAATASSRG
jgi:hypothetical protein